MTCQQFDSANITITSGVRGLDQIPVVCPQYQYLSAFSLLRNTTNLYWYRFTCCDIVQKPQIRVADHATWQCTPGFYSLAGSSECSPCPSTYYCPDGISYSICPEGYFCADATSKVQCASGSQCPAGSTSEQKCLAGRYCPNYVTNVPCPKGYYCPEVTQKIKCAIGAYCPEVRKLIF